MNLTKSKVILKKINTLHDNIELTGGMSKIEKDLFLDYIKNLYEMVLEEKEISSKKKKKEKQRAKEISSKKESIKVYTPELEVEDDQEFDLIEEYDDRQDHIEKPMPIAAPTEVTPQSIPQSSPAPAASVKRVDAKIEALFNDDMLTQEAYRFSQQAIADVSKAMGINEKILTVNLLFNKDDADFNYVATKLNYFSSYDEAATYLKTEIAEKYNWAEEAKRSKALDFIKLVKRKYIA